MKPSKTLIVVRHGHAIAGEDDFARTLSGRGIAEVRATGARLQARGLRVDHVLTSSAPRAAATAQELATLYQLAGPIEQARDLYLAAPRVLFEAVACVDDKIDTLMLVGHNPGLSTFVELLTGNRTELATAEARHVELDVPQWAMVTSGVGQER